MNFFLKVKEFGELLTFKMHKKDKADIYIHILCLAFIIYLVVSTFFNQRVSMSTNLSVNLHIRQPAYNVTFTVFTAPSTLTFSR